MMFGLGRLAAVAATVISMAAGSANAYAADKDIVDTAVAAGQFKTLAAALTAAGLVDTLKGLVRSRSSPRPTALSPSCRRARWTTC